MHPLVDSFIARKRNGARVVALTAYDYAMARILDEAGVDLILVGDSLGMVVMGHPDTTSVTLEMIEHHVRAAAGGVSRALVAADMPIGTYSTPDAAVASARRLLSAGAAAVKIEGGASVRGALEALSREGIPILGHLGMLPQHVREEGGYHVKGRDPAEAAALRDDIRLVEACGAFAVVLELVAPPLARELSASVAIPTIGIGSGEGCDGEIRVIHDIIGLFPWFRPKFARPVADVAGVIATAVRDFAADVRHAESAGRS